MQLIDLLSIAIIILMVILGTCGGLRQLVRFCLDVGLGLFLSCLIVCCLIYGVDEWMPNCASKMGFDKSPIVATIQHMSQTIHKWSQ